jgi:hypothetical protein
VFTVATCLSCSSNSLATTLSSLAPSVFVTPTAAPTSVPSLARSTPPTSPPTKAPTVTPTVTATPTPQTLIEIPAGTTRSVDATVAYPGDRLFAQDGAQVAYVTTRDGLELADLATGFKTTVVRSSGHERVLWVDLNGNDLVWAHGSFTGNRALTPCDVQGGLSWAIVARDLATSTDQEVASGTNERVGACSAVAPALAVDDGLVAYATEGPTDQRPNGSTIVIRSLATGEVVREVETQRIVTNLDLSSGDVAYIEGIYPADPDPYFPFVDERLMISTAANPEPRLVAHDPSSISFAVDRLAWVDSGTDPESNLTATADGLQAVRIGDQLGPPWSDPFTSGHFVTFAQDGVPQVWDERTNTTYTIETPDRASVVSSDGGWLVWYGYHEVAGDLVIELTGLPISELPVIGG